MAVYARIGKGTASNAKAECMGNARMKNAVECGNENHLWPGTHRIKRLTSSLVQNMASIPGETTEKMQSAFIIGYLRKRCTT